ncbi:hypothetical protein M7I_4703 [Glarea lozoyensis 74030]|uniref:Uncharacterized protein n=1 Tax=Glarea lozoyensis (strain ATCC 74030 / MF5533) TaxID=1104152 RepID=H0EPW5_GLAL7|nr:hypothetical protein M7I_4703 [Glarea lozoyensis 74030]
MIRTEPAKRASSFQLIKMGGGPKVPWSKQIIEHEKEKKAGSS